MKNINEPVSTEEQAAQLAAFKAAQGGDIFVGHPVGKPGITILATIVSGIWIIIRSDVSEQAEVADAPPMGDIHWAPGSGTHRFLFALLLSCSKPKITAKRVVRLPADMLAN